MVKRFWYHLAKFLWRFEGYKNGFEQMLDESLIEAIRLDIKHVMKYLLLALLAVGLSGCAIRNNRIAIAACIDNGGMPVVSRTNRLVDCWRFRKI